MKITSPTLLLNELVCRANIRKMASKAARHQLTLKPHVKTHQSADMGDWLKEYDIRAITVSSIDMAEYFTLGSWRDIPSLYR